MDSNVADEVEPDADGGSRRTAILIGIAIVALFFLINDIVGWVNGGGLFSIVSARHAVSARASMIDVDSAGLRTIFVTGCCLVVLGIASLTGANLDKRMPTILIMFAIFGGGFILDGIFDDGIVAHYMAAHGYGRCARRDHRVGNGKSRVWFHSYVLDPALCRPDDYIKPGTAWTPPT